METKLNFKNEIKIALCFSGQIRTGIYISENIKRYFGELYNNCDVFIHTWNVNSEIHMDFELSHKFHPISIETIEEYKRLYQPKKIIVDDFYKYEDSSDPIFYSQLISNNLRKEYEVENGIKYDFVVKMRTDGVFNPKAKFIDEINEVLKLDYQNTIFTLDALEVYKNEKHFEGIMWFAVPHLFDISIDFYYYRKNSTLIGEEYRQLNMLTRYFKEKNIKWSIFPVNNEMIIYRLSRHFNKGVTLNELESSFSKISYSEIISKYNHIPLVDLIHNNTCQITKKNDLEFLYTFINFPIYIITTNQLECEDILIDMEWVISQYSGLIQLSKVIPPKVLYSKNHNSGKIGFVWKKHHENFAKFIFQYKPNSVFEIGASHTILYNEYEKLQNIDWEIIDPNVIDKNNSNIKFINEFFNDEYKSLDTFNDKTIVHSHVLEHIYEPDKFINLISNILSDGQQHIFSIPNLKNMLDLKYNNTLNFEHLSLLSENYVDYLLNKNEFRIIKKEYFMDSHSIFYSTIKDSKIVKIKPNFSGLYEKNKTLFNDYITHNRNLVNEINIKLFNNGLGFIFGAHITTQMLISFGLDINRIICIIDNDTDKQGMRLYGTPLIVKPLDILKDIENPMVVLRMGIYDKEIKDDIIKNYNKNTIFI